MATPRYPVMTPMRTATTSISFANNYICLSLARRNNNITRKYK
jgi:hypothetical protein